MKKKPTGNLYLLIVLILMLTKSGAFGQCPVSQTRTYANTQQTNFDFLLTNVDNPGGAADNDPTTYSTLSRFLGVGNLISVKQFIKFNTRLTAGTPVTVKLAIPSGLLSLLDGIEIQPFKDLADGGFFGGGWQATAVGPPITNTTLLGLLNGAGDQEITITPSADYDGVWINLNKGVALLQSLKVYGAYTTKNSTASLGCNKAVDVLSGVAPITPLGSIGTALGTVADPEKAIDTDLTSYAQIKAVATVLSSVYHTTQFSSPSQKGDTIKMIIENTGTGLLDLDLMTGFSIQRYNGTAAVGLPIVASNTSLELKLFPTGSGGQYELKISPPDNLLYDRVEVKIGGLVSLGILEGLKIYNVTRVIANPTTSIDGLAGTTKAVCAGSTSTLSVNNIQDCTTYKWYDALTDGNLLYTGTSFTPTAASLNPLSPNNYYVEASRDGCTDVTARAKSTLTVNPKPTITPSGTPKGCNSETVALSYTATNAPTTYTVTWNSAAIAQGFSNITDNSLPAGSLDIPLSASATSGTYTGNLVVKNANGCVSPDTPISVIVDAKPTQPTVNLNN